MTIKIEDCKKAIVEFIQNNPGHVAKQFCDISSIEEFEAPSKKESNWKRREKRKLTKLDGQAYNLPAGTTMRMFECSAPGPAQDTYEDELRACTFDDGSAIIRVVVGGE
jgi:hypothetical protein